MTPEELQSIKVFWQHEHFVEIPYNENRKLILRLVSALEDAWDKNEALHDTLDSMEDILNKIWWELIANNDKKYGDWEYLGQIYNHLKLVIEGK